MRSHPLLAGFPKLCYGCGEPVVKGQSVWIETLLSRPVERRTWHFEHHPSQAGRT